MKRFNSNTVKSSSHLAVTPEKTRRFEAQVYKAAIERSEGKMVVKVREYLAPIKADFVPRGFGRKIKRLSHEKRALILQKAEMRVAFFKSLGVSV
jgi:hypothetical protein